MELPPESQAIVKIKHGMHTPKPGRHANTQKRDTLDQRISTHVNQECSILNRQGRILRVKAIIS